MSISQIVVNNTSIDGATSSGSGGLINIISNNNFNLKILNSKITNVRCN